MHEISEGVDELRREGREGGWEAGEGGVRGRRRAMRVVFVVWWWEEKGKGYEREQDMKAALACMECLLGRCCCLHGKLACMAAAALTSSWVIGLSFAADRSWPCFLSSSST